MLAGGKASRMGGQNKGLIKLAGKTLIEHVMDRLDPQLTNRFISANEAISEYESLGYPVVQDVIPGQLGPLAGIYTTMQVAKKDWLLVVPCDVPLLPLDYAERMLNHDGSVKAYVAFDGERQHSGCCLLHHSLQADLQQALEQNHLAVHHFLTEHDAQQVDFSDHCQAFININTPEQLEALEENV